MAQDRRLLITREFDQIVDREEIIREFLGADKRKLGFNRLTDFLRKLRPVAFMRRRPHQMRQPVVGGPAARNRLVRIFIFQLFKVEMNMCSKAFGFCHSFGTGME